MIRARVLLSFACALLAPALCEGSRYAGDLLDVGVGGRALGMGGAFVSIADDPSGPFYNPAGIGGLRR